MVCFSHHFMTFLFNCLFYALKKPWVKTKILITDGWERSGDIVRRNQTSWGGGVFGDKRQQPKSVKRCLENKNRLHLLILHLKRLRASQLQYCFLTKALLSGSQLTLQKERHLLQLGSKILGFLQHQRPCEQKQRTIHYFQKK